MENILRIPFWSLLLYWSRDIRILFRRNILFKEFSMTLFVLESEDEDIPTKMKIHTCANIRECLKLIPFFLGTRVFRKNNCRFFLNSFIVNNSYLVISSILHC